MSAAAMIAPRPAGTPAALVRASVSPLVRTMTEEELLENVVDLCKVQHWYCYHTRNSRGSVRGFPDLVLIHPVWRRVLFVELKSTKGRLTVDQQHWMSMLVACGMETAVWRPADLPEIQAVLCEPPPRRPAAPSTDRASLAAEMVPVALDLAALVRTGNRAGIGEVLALLTPEAKDALIVVLAAGIDIRRTDEQLYGWTRPRHDVRKAPAMPAQPRRDPTGVMR